MPLAGERRRSPCAPGAARHQRCRCASGLSSRSVSALWTSRAGEAAGRAGRWRGGSPQRRLPHPTRDV
jgi:hypothetical protein